MELEGLIMSNHDLMRSRYGEIQNLGEFGVAVIISPRWRSLRDDYSPIFGDFEARKFKLDFIEN